MAAAIPGKVLIDIFGKGQVADKVKNFDFSKISVKTSDTNDYLHLDLAPSYGKLTSEAVKMMDEKLKVMIAGTMKDLGRVPANERKWDKIISVMMQNPLLEPMSEAVINRSDKLLKDGGTSAFKTDGSPNSAIVKEVKAWFTKLISDDDVLSSTKIDIDVMGKIVAQTGATVDSIETFFGKKEYHEKTMIDIGVLRFPDIDNPFFKVYRIQLTAWSDCSRVLFVQKDMNGITGEYNCKKFRPRAEVIAGLKQETRKLAISQAEDLFA